MGTDMGGSPPTRTVIHRRGGPGAQQACPQMRRMVRTNLDGPAGHSSECAGYHHLIPGQASFTADQCLGGVLAPPRSVIRQRVKRNEARVRAKGGEPARKASRSEVGVTGSSSLASRAARKLRLHSGAGVDVAVDIAVGQRIH
jgi:hypothetical protein